MSEMRLEEHHATRNSGVKEECHGKVSRLLKSMVSYIPCAPLGVFDSHLSDQGQLRLSTDSLLIYVAVFMYDHCLRLPE